MLLGSGRNDVWKSRHGRMAKPVVSVFGIEDTTNEEENLAVRGTPEKFSANADVVHILRQVLPDKFVIDFLFEIDAILCCLSDFGPSNLSN